MDLRSIALCFLFLLIGLGSGCSSIRTRISEHALEFQTYPEAVQKMIQRGEIDKDFSQNMVYIAKGAPSRVVRTAEGSNEMVLWYYEKTKWIPLSGGEASDTLSSPFGFPVVGPGPSRPTGVLQSTPYLVIQFKNDQVIDWK